MVLVRMVAASPAANGQSAGFHCTVHGTGIRDNPSTQVSVSHVYDMVLLSPLQPWFDSGAADSDRVGTAVLWPR